jgi:hypothetical protein
LPLILSARRRSLYLDSSPSSAILKTPDRNYTMRQRNTSNSLILVSPALSNFESDTPPGIPVEGLKVIATLHEMIELTVEVSQPPPGGSGVSHTGSRGKWHEKFGKGR